MENEERIDMITACGHSVIFNSPESTPVDFRDIEIHTRNICRYNGALNWRLVQHLALCGALVDYTQDSNDEMVIQRGYAIAHDFHESYVCDIPTGFKPYLTNYKSLEDFWEAYVHYEIDLPLKYRDDNLIKHIDSRALVCEMFFMNHPAASLVMKLNGGKPTKNELWAWHATRALNLQQCWDYCFENINKARGYLEALYTEEERWLLKS